MLEDKLRSTDWEATYEAIEEAVARESYLSWLREQERKTGTSRQGLQVREEGEMREEGGREKGEWEVRREFSVHHNMEKLLRCDKGVYS